MGEGEGRRSKGSGEEEREGERGKEQEGRGMWTMWTMWLLTWMHTMWQQTLGVHRGRLSQAVPVVVGSGWGRGLDAWMNGNQSGSFLEILQAVVVWNAWDLRESMAINSDTSMASSGCKLVARYCNLPDRYWHGKHKCIPDITPKV